MDSKTAIRPKGTDVVRKYEDHAVTPHGRLRHELLHHYYSLFIADKKISRIIDVGGGSGLLVDSLLKEHRNLNGILIDDDEAMITRAEERLHEQIEAKRVSVHKGSDQDVPRILSSSRLPHEGVLLSFNHAIEYIDDKMRAIRTLTGCLPKGTYFGIMYLNNAHEAFRKLLFKDDVNGVTQQLKSFDLDMIHFGMAKALDAEAMDAYFHDQSIHLVSQFGIRCFADVKQPEFVGNHYREVARMETALGMLPDFMPLARYRLKFYRI
jgi:ubiquinone/menaquinone biosynthesis C-methylase UbiE